MGLALAIDPLGLSSTLCAKYVSSHQFAKPEVFYVFIFSSACS